MKRLKEMLRGREQHWVDAKSTVRDAVRYLCDHKMGAVLVKAGDEAVGVFSERDLMCRVIDAGLDCDAVLVEEVMRRNPIKIHIDDDIVMAKALMQMNHVRHLLVVEGEGEVVGLLSVRDLLKEELSKSEEVIHKLNDKYYQSTYKARWRMSSNRLIIDHYHPHSQEK